MNREIITTADGSHTVAIPEMRVTYHSHHGAVQESMHVFIEAGLHWRLGLTGQATKVATHIISEPTSGQTSKPPLHIFEMGFGTGLNAYLTALEAEKLQQPIHYTAVEKYPLAAEEAAALNYGNENRGLFQQLHKAPWEINIPVTSLFSLKKCNTDFQDFLSEQPFDIINFDAFAPTAQPELWTEAIFSKLYHQTNIGGVLVTYCSKGVVRRAMQAAGFTVTKIPGPPGKREMVRAEKRS
jgi:tRNA U34 5-methylaminomethyl-2-thiouridine-forming methyltransferase MnmC